MRKSTLIHDKIKGWLGSKIVFYLILALFVLQAGIIAVRNSYPMAFDESFHVGIIQLYSQQWSPFFSNLPDSTGQFGPLATSPSYLYHYLMSFPYRIIELFTQNTFITILVLRFINIGIFAAGIVLFRKVLRYAGAANPMVHLVLLAFVLLPIQTFTAAHVNYDNLIFLITAAVLLYTLRFASKLRKENVFDVKSLLLLTSFCFLGSQVKYSFLPIFAGIGIFTVAVIALWLKRHWRESLPVLKESLNLTSKYALISLAGVLLISVSLFGWRFGYNLATYGKLMPDCAEVMSVSACQAWGPWARDYALGQQHTPAPSLAQKIEFTKVWINIMGNQLFAVLDANNGGAAVEPIRNLVVAGKLLIIGGIFFVLLQWRRLRQYAMPLALFAVVSAVYLAALYFNNYAAYTEYGIPIAIQGRYLLPVLLLLMIVLARAYSLTFERRPQIKAAILLTVLVIGMQGAGIITYFKRTDQSWVWSAAAAANIDRPSLIKESLSASKQ